MHLRLNTTLLKYSDSSQLLVHLFTRKLGLLSLATCTSILFTPLKTLAMEPRIDLLLSEALHIYEFHFCLILPLR